MSATERPHDWNDKELLELRNDLRNADYCEEVIDQIIARVLLHDDLATLTTERDRYREALADLLSLIDEEDWYNDRRIEIARQALEGK